MRQRRTLDPAGASRSLSEPASERARPCDASSTVSSPSRGFSVRRASIRRTRPRPRPRSAPCAARRPSRLRPRSVSHLIRYRRPFVITLHPTWRHSNPSRSLLQPSEARAGSHGVPGELSLSLGRLSRHSAVNTSSSHVARGSNSLCLEQLRALGVVHPLLVHGTSHTRVHVRSLGNARPRRTLGQWSRPHSAPHGPRQPQLGRRRVVRVGV